MHRYMLATGEGFCFYLQRISSRTDQETSLSAGVLDGRAQEPFDEFFENHLARKCLGSFNHCREIELFDRRFDSTRWSRRALVLPQPWMELVELPHLSVGPPSEITIPRILEVEVRNLLEAARRVEACSQLVGEAFNVHESVGARRTNRLFVEALRVEFPIFDSGYLSTDDCGAAFKILRAVFRPFLELSVVGAQCLDVLLEVIRRRAVAGRRMA